MNRGHLKRRVLDLIPPVLLPTVKRLTRRWRTPGVPEWEYVPEGWSRARDDLRGWNDPSVLEAYRTKLDAFRETLADARPFAFGSSAELDLGAPSVEEQNVSLIFAYALLEASRHSTRVSVLDWGGGLGAYGLVARAILPPDIELDYHCKEVPRIAEYGRREIPEVTFWDDEACLDRTYDLVFVSSALQYTEEWRPLLHRLAGAVNGRLLLSRVPIVHHHASFVVLQRAHTYRFETEYLGWVFNQQELLDVASDAGVQLTREFVIGHQPDVVGAPEQDEAWSFLFRRSTA
ncbi:MAG TPA: methyltransferase, TIGR04325 family [Acidimicrobiia bacterium]|jgi:putative methyltransferase (TIGR04325 family)